MGWACDDPSPRGRACRHHRWRDPPADLADRRRARRAFVVDALNKSSKLIERLIRIPEVPPELIFAIEEELLMRDRLQAVRERQVRCREMKESRLREKSRR